MNFALILFVLTVVTGCFWLLDVFVLAPTRKKEAQDELRAFDADNAEALRRGEKTVEAARNAILIRAKERPRWLEYTAGFFPIIFFIFVLRSFLFEPFRIPSGSMMPTLETGDMILVNKYTYGLRIPVLNTKILDVGEPQRGDVVVFKYPPNPDIDYIKRVVGLPGDKISYINKKLEVNGVPVPLKDDGTYFDEHKMQELIQSETTHKILTDKYTPSGAYALPTHTDPKACEYVPGGLVCTVPKDKYFVLGDNRDNSEDSRYWGFVPEKNLVGKAFIVWLNVSKPSRLRRKKMLPLEELEKRIGYTFKNKKYLKRAVTHRSFSSEHNERLEFLGDSVLGCVIGYALFQKEDHFNEGSLSRVRANLVKMQTLAEIGEKIGVWEFLCVGEGEMHQGGNRRPSTMSDAVEAIFGAIFIDGGFEQAQTVIIRLYEPMLSQLTAATLGKDAKTMLQEVLQSKHLGLPSYEVVDVKGAAHEQEFVVEAVISKLGVVTTGVGRSRRQAEQEAAQKALTTEAIKNL